MNNIIDSNALKIALKSIIAPTQFHYFETLDSTNRFLKEQSHIAPNTLACCIADEQTAGRGRFGKAWISPKGLNIYCSIGINITLHSNLSAIGLMTGLTVLRALASYMPEHHLKIKWPNDILCEHKKLCGILIERQGTQLVIGIGINVNARLAQSPHPEKPWGSIYEFTGQITNRNQLLIDLITMLSVDLKRFWKYGFSDFMTEWEHVDYLKDKKIKMSIEDKEEIGFARGITEVGLLKFEDLQGEMHTLTSGNTSLLTFL